MGKKYDTEFDVSSYTLTKKFKDAEGTTVQISVKDLPENARDYVVEYGIRQIMNDCHASDKTIEEAIASTKQKAEDLQNGVIRRGGGGGLGLGVNLEQLTQALANVLFGGDLDQAKAKLEPFVPTEDDDEDTTKAKKARLRKIRGMGEIKMEIDRLAGKSTASLLDAPLPEAEGDEKAA